MQQRIGAVIRAYEEQGFHRTGTDVDRISGDWLVNQVSEIGLEAKREGFSLSRVDPVRACLVVNGRTIEGLPLFDGTFTSRAERISRMSAEHVMRRLGDPRCGPRRMAPLDESPARHSTFTFALFTIAPHFGTSFCR